MSPVLWLVDIQHQNHIQNKIFNITIMTPVLWLVDIHTGVVPRELLPRLDALVLSRELRCPVALYFEILTSLILSEIITTIVAITNTI